MYGRAFQETNGIGAPFSGIGPGTIEPGIYSYKFLPSTFLLPCFFCFPASLTYNLYSTVVGAQVIHDTDLGASYSYDPLKRELVSFDDPHIVRVKSEYTISRGLGGNFFWEIAQDKTGSDQAISHVSKQALGTLDQTPNHISYPSSKYDNIKSNMGNGPAPPSTDPLPPTPPPPPPPPSTGCGAIAAWAAGVCLCFHFGHYHSH